MQTLYLKWNLNAFKHCRHTKVGTKRRKNNNILYSGERFEQRLAAIRRGGDRFFETVAWRVWTCFKNIKASKLIDPLFSVRRYLRLFYDSLIIGKCIARMDDRTRNKYLYGSILYYRMVYILLKKINITSNVNPYKKLCKSNQPWTQINTKTPLQLHKDIDMINVNIQFHTLPCYSIVINSLYYDD